MFYSHVLITLGVMRLVGDAIAEGIQTENLVVLGIATEKLVTDGEWKTDAKHEFKYLENNHDIVIVK